MITLFLQNPFFVLLLITLVIYIFIISVNRPIIIAAIYPITFLDVIQSRFSFGGVTPAIYIGGILILVGILNIKKAFLISKVKGINPLYLIFLLIVFPTWMLIRFLLAGSDIRITITFMANILAILSLLIIINSKHRLNIINISIGVTLIILSISVILVFYFPSLHGIFGVFEQDNMTRMMGLSRDPNYGGTMMAVGFVYSLVNFIYSLETKNKKLLCLSILLILITLYSLLLTLSRGAILSIIICSVFMIFLGKTKFINYFGFMTIVGLVVILINQNTLIINNLFSRFSIMTYDNSDISRLQIFQRGIDVIKENWLWGVGQYLGFHNTYLDIAVYGGVVAFFVFLLIITTVITLNFKILSSNNYKYKMNARFIIFGLFSILINGALIGMEFEKILWFMIGLGFINILLSQKDCYNAQAKFDNMLFNDGSRRNRRGNLSTS